ncbi:F-box domain-containing protein [Madurella fahalii]|uniref:F-box domain-containing protein n=1 Tax=Madurella fahalii TaxID=1157608 RepID=A0ABQ0FZD7_9PEZI
MDAATSSSTAKLSSLPPELVTKVLLQSVSETPTCVFALLCPEWNVCERKYTALEKILRSTRVDTYTLPSHPGEKGHISTTFEHGQHDHIRFPLMRDPRYVNGEALSGFYHREMVRAWTGECAIVVGQELSHVGRLWRAMPREEVEELLILRERRNLGLLPFVDDYFLDGPVDGEVVHPAGPGELRNVTVCSIDGREKDVLPQVGTSSSSLSHVRGEEGEEEPKYLFQRIRHLVLNTVPGLAQLEPWDAGVMSPTRPINQVHNLETVRDRIRFERKANFCLRWKALERLESLFLDLRGLTYLHKEYLSLQEVGELALSLQGMGLKLLVIAGLRSWLFYPGPQPADISEVGGGIWEAEQKVWIDDRKIGWVNWWRTFTGALQPGGRLILVDKQNGGAEFKLVRRDPPMETLNY